MPDERVSEIWSRVVTITKNPDSCFYYFLFPSETRSSKKYDFEEMRSAIKQNLNYATHSLGHD